MRLSPYCLALAKGHRYWPETGGVVPEDQLDLMGRLIGDAFLAVTRSIAEVAVRNGEAEAFNRWADTLEPQVRPLGMQAALLMFRQLDRVSFEAALAEEAALTGAGRQELFYRNISATYSIFLQTLLEENFRVFRGAP